MHKLSVTAINGLSLYYQMMWGSWNIKHWEALQIVLLVKTMVCSGSVLLVTTEAFTFPPSSDGWSIRGLERSMCDYAASHFSSSLQWMRVEALTHMWGACSQPLWFSYDQRPKAPEGIDPPNPLTRLGGSSISALAWSRRWKIQAACPGFVSLISQRRSSPVIPHARLPSPSTQGRRLLRPRRSFPLWVFEGWRLATPKSVSISLHPSSSGAGPCEAVALLPRELRARPWCAAVTAFSFVLIPFPSSHHRRGVSGCDQGRCHLPSRAQRWRSCEMMPLQPAVHPSSSAAPLCLHVD